MREEGVIFDGVDVFDEVKDGLVSSFDAAGTDRPRGHPRTGELWLTLVLREALAPRVLKIDAKHDVGDRQPDPNQGSEVMDAFMRVAGGRVVYRVRG